MNRRLLVCAAAAGAVLSLIGVAAAIGTPIGIQAPSGQRTDWARATTVMPANSSEQRAEIRRRIITTFPANGSICCRWTAGQTVRGPVGITRLRAFTVRMFSDRQLVVRAFLYRWSARRMHAIGDALWRGVEPLQPNVNTRLRFATNGVRLCCARRYVFFVSLSESRRIEPRSSIDLTSDPGTLHPYPNGRFVYLQNVDSRRRWTRGTWKFIDGGTPTDLAFRMVLLR